MRLDIFIIMIVRCTLDANAFDENSQSCAMHTSNTPAIGDGWWAIESENMHNLKIGEIKATACGVTDGLKCIADTSHTHTQRDTQRASHNDVYFSVCANMQQILV